MMDFDDDRPVCDFCKMKLNDDEELQPIYVGKPAQPKPHYLTEVVPRAGSNRGVLLGQPIAVYNAMYKALHGCPDIEIKESIGVHEIGAGGFVTTEKSEISPVKRPDTKPGVRGDVAFESRIDDSKVAVSMKINPNEVDSTPDAEVCEGCADMFESL